MTGQETGTTRLLKFFSLALTLALTATPLVAQQQAPAEQEVPPPPEISDERLEEVAEAFLEVSEVQRDVQERLEQAPAPEEAQRIQAEGNDQILATLEQHEVPVDEYTEVMTATQNHTSFRERFLDALNRVQDDDSESS